MRLLNGWRTQSRRNRAARIKAEKARRLIAQHRAEDATKMPRRESDCNGSAGVVNFTCGVTS